MEKVYKAQCVEVKCKRRRKLLAKLRGGTAQLEVEMSRWQGCEQRRHVVQELSKWRGGGCGALSDKLY